VCVLCFSAAIFAGIYLSPDERVLSTLPFQFLQSLIYWVAALGALFQAFGSRHASHVRRADCVFVAIAWAFLGSANELRAVGNLSVTEHQQLRGIADGIHLAMFPLLIPAISGIFRRHQKSCKSDGGNGSTVIGASMAVLVWYYLVRPILDLSGFTWISLHLSEVYPTCDLLALFAGLLIVFMSTASGKLRRTYCVLAAGIVLQMVADMTFSYDVFWRTNNLDPVSADGWYAACIALLLVSAMPLVWPDTLEAKSAGLDQSRRSPVGTVMSLALPYIAICTACSLVALHDYGTSGNLSRMTLIFACVLVPVVISRQLVTSFDNHQLADKLGTIKASLEDTVSNRTRQLRALHKLGRAVSETLEADQVLVSAVNELQSILPSNDVLIWYCDPRLPDEDQVLQLSGAFGLTGDRDIYHLSHLLNASDTSGLLRVGDRDPSHGDEALLFAPLKARHRRMGMIGLLRLRDGFASSDVDLLESIGVEVGTALYNARRYAEAVDEADRDPLSGLYNHRAVHQRLAQELAESIASGRPIAVLMMDVNNFKRFNDAHGHLTGDQVLRSVAAALTGVFGVGAVIGRYGGDEFVVVIPAATPDTALAKGCELLAWMRERAIQVVSELRPIPVSLTIGISSFPDDGETVNELLGVADANLYAAKSEQMEIMLTRDRKSSCAVLPKTSSYNVLDSMVKAVDAKDRYTRRHSEDVTEYAIWIAEELGLSDEHAAAIKVCGLLHDIGKIGVPDDLLKKPGRLTSAEYEVMKRHPALGAGIVGTVPGDSTVLGAIRHHHERWDGLGYPDGLSGLEIPLIARILSVADAVSAMATDRPYRTRLGWDQVLFEVGSNSGTQFDPDIADAFIRTARKRTAVQAVQSQGVLKTLTKAA
jgi:diguanylate cyclase (GGDEF)-like protein/putative nucleotidyltransferase with HDIG domain